MNTCFAMVSMFNAKLKFIFFCRKQKTPFTLQKGVIASHRNATVSQYKTDFITGLKKGVQFKNGMAGKGSKSLRLDYEKAIKYFKVDLIIRCMLLFLSYAY